MADPIPLREWTPERRAAWNAHVHRTFKESTIETYQRGLDMFDEWRGDDPITIENIEAWLIALEGMGYAPRTVTLRAHGLRALKSFWVAEGILPSTEPDWPRKNSTLHDGPVTTPLTSDERSALRYAASQLHSEQGVRMRDAALIGCLLDAGPLRVSTICRLPITAVEWPTPQWSTPPPMDQIQAATRLTDPATRRSTHLSAETGDALARYLWSEDGWRSIRYHADGPRGQFLWPAMSHRRAQRPLTRQGVFTICSAAGERAGISRPVGPDLLRRIP
jgi:site-specific recombinase XerD